MEQLSLRDDSQRPFEILLVEDSATDVLLAKEALDDAKIPNHLHVVREGVAATAFLHRVDSYADAPRPDLILLDLNLPKKDGREVLAEIKEDPSLRAIPVVVLTISKAEEDLSSSYAHRANCYITKPFDFERLVQVMRDVAAFWLGASSFDRLAFHRLNKEELSRLFLHNVNESRRRRDRNARLRQPRPRTAAGDS